MGLMNLLNVSEILYNFQKIEAGKTHPNPSREGITQLLNSEWLVVLFFIYVSTISIDEKDKDLLNN
jgi:hypothetical protein